MMSLYYSTGILSILFTDNIEHFQYKQNSDKKNVVIITYYNKILKRMGINY